MFSIKESWSILEANAKGPLPKGAKAKQIDELEKEIGLTFPPDYREFLQMHDGSKPCSISPFKIGGGSRSFLSVKGIRETYQGFIDTITREKNLHEDSDAPAKEHPVQWAYWMNGWVPIAENFCGDYVFIDLSPAPTGTVGQIVDQWHETLETTLLAKSFQEWLDELAREVQSGTYRFGTPEDDEEEDEE